MIQWEYKLVNHMTGKLDMDKLEALGNEGWDLVSVQVSAFEKSGFDFRAQQWQWFFKRPKEGSYR